MKDDESEQQLQMKIGRTILEILMASSCRLLKYNPDDQYLIFLTNSLIHVYIYYQYFSVIEAETKIRKNIKQF